MSAPSGAETTPTLAVTGQARRDPLPRLGVHGEAQALAARRRVGGAGARHQHDELLAAGAHDDVVRADVLDEQVGDADQHLVADVVAEVVVDRLEVVEVDDREADRAGWRRRRARGSGGCGGR